MTDSSISNYIRLPPTSTNREFLAFIEHAKKVKTIAVDTESTGKEIRDDRGWAMGLSISYEITDDVVASCYFPLRHKSDNLDREIWDALKVLLSAYPGTIVFHNSKFDLTSLLTLGIDVMGTFWDTMLMAHMVNENIKSKALDYLAQTYLKDSGKERSVAMNLFIKDGLGWEWAPPLLIWDYACHDTEMTYRLYKKLYAEMESQDLIDLWPVEQKFVRVIREMESRGVKIDKEHCARELIKGSMAMSNIIGELGYDPAKPTDMAKLFFDKLKLPVVKTTPGGKPSFDKFAMEMYDELLADSDNPTAQRVLEYRGWQKTLTSNYRPYLELISPDGRLRPNYKIHGTVTGRMSCEKPNLQQIPRASDKEWNGELKQAFIPKYGYSLYEADYSQLELRLAAAYAKEEGLLQAFAEGRDVFTEMSNQLGMARHDAKTMTYTIQYGGGINRLSQVFKISSERAGELRSNFYQTYPGFRAKTEAASRKAKSVGVLKYWSGRKRHFVDREAEAHKAFNSVIQGGAAEIMKHTMIRLFEEVDNNDCQMLLQVHDSIIFEIRTELLSTYVPLIKSVMEAVIPDFGVIFTCEINEWGK